MDNIPRTTQVPQMAFTAYARKSTTGENYPGTPVQDSVPAYESRLEWLDSTSGIRRFNLCQHYLKTVDLVRPYVDGSDTWVSPTNHAAGFWNIDYVTSPYCWGGSRYGNPSTTGMIGTFGQWDSPFTGLPLLYVADSSGRRVVVPDIKSTELLIDRSLRAMLPGIRPRLSVLNTLHELKDIKTVVRSYGRFKEAFEASGRLTEAYTISKQALKLLTGKSKTAVSAASLRSILKASADGWLQAQFNVAPLLRDIAGIRSAIREVDSELKRLIANQGRLQRSHYRCTLDNTYATKTEDRTASLSTSFVNSQTHGRREVTYPIRMFYATLEYRYKIPLYRGPEDYLKMAALGDALGANWNPAIIWNAIPWSFVVDWLFGVSRWLDQFKTRNIEPVTSIGRYCYSYHIVRDIVVSHGEGSQVVPFGRIREEAYYRKPHVPDLRYSIESSGLNLKEFSLAGALALTRRSF